MASNGATCNASLILFAAHDELARRIAAVVGVVSAFLAIHHIVAARTGFPRRLVADLPAIEQAVAGNHRAVAARRERRLDGRAACGQKNYQENRAAPHQIPSV